MSNMFTRADKGVLTDSAYLASKHLLRRAGMWQHMEAFVASGLSSEETRDQILWLTGRPAKDGRPPVAGVLIPAGLLEPVMAKIRRRLRREQGPLNLDAEETVNDFGRDRLGLAIAKHRGESPGRTTELYKMICQQV